MKSQESLQKYIAVWEKSLRGFAGWSEEQISTWVKARVAKFEGDYTMMVHEPPVYWIADELIPSTLENQIPTREAIELRQQILHVIENGDFGWHDDPDYDWDAARQRIRGLLAEYEQRFR